MMSAYVWPARRASVSCAKPAAGVGEKPGGRKKRPAGRPRATAKNSGLRPGTDSRKRSPSGPPPACFVLADAQCFCLCACHAGDRGFESSGAPGWFIIDESRILQAAHPPPYAVGTGLLRDPSGPQLCSLANALRLTEMLLPLLRFLAASGSASSSLAHGLGVAFSLPIPVFPPDAAERRSRLVQTAGHAQSHTV